MKPRNIITIARVGSTEYEKRHPIRVILEYKPEPIKHRVINAITT